MADNKQSKVKYGEIIAKCWEDEAYKKRFLEDPKDVLREAGVAVEEGVTYKVIEQPKLVQYVVLPCMDTKEAVQTLAKSLLNQVEKKEDIIPGGAEVRIIQNTDDIRYLILPASPKSLAEAELRMVAGGQQYEVQTDFVVETVSAEAEVTVTTTTAAAEAEIAVVVVLV